MILTLTSRISVEKLSSKIEHDDITVDYKQYVNLPAVENLQFKFITKETTIKAIDELENKSSSGHDGISNKLLKVIKCNIIKSLTIIINQVITTGIVPNTFKVVNIIPIFKKGDSSLLVNYRPISLLPTFLTILKEQFMTKCANILTTLIN